MIEDPIASSRLFAVGLDQDGLRNDSSATDRRIIQEVLSRFVELSPLVRAGHVWLVPHQLFHFAEENIVEEIQAEVRNRKILEDFDNVANDVHFFAQYVAAQRARYWAYEASHTWTPLTKFSAALRLSLEVADATNDLLLRQYIGRGLQSRRINSMMSAPLPRLDRLSVSELSILLSSDEVLAEFRSTLASILDNVDGSNDLEAVAALVDGRVESELRSAIERLERHLRTIPNWPDLVGAGSMIGATIFAGLSTGELTLPTGVLAAASGAGLAAEWLRRSRRRIREDRAYRVLRELI